MANGKPFNIDVIKFDGDPDLLPFFIEQVKNVTQINKLNDIASVAFLKSKLQGPALKFVTQRSDLLLCNQFDVLENELKKFFAPTSKTQDLLDFNSLILQPAETIKNFNHRLNVLASKVYVDVHDAQALNKIKFLKFITAIPSNLRIKIQEENITDYARAVERAQQLQDIFNSEKILSSCSTSHNESNLTESLKILTEKVNALQITQNSSQNEKDNSSPVHEQNHFKFGKKNTRGFRYYKNQNKTNFKKFSPHMQDRNKRVKCQLCFKFGHNAQNCFKWTRLNTRRSDQFANKRYYNNSNNNNYQNNFQEN